jgi:serine/threonine protein kinase
LVEPGDRIGNYLVGEPIAGGGMGMVYRGTHTRLGRKVAIKVLLPNFAHSEKVRHRFEQEAYVQAQLEHPNIVRVSDMVVEDRNLALVMELIEGPSLETVLTEQKPGPWALDEALALFKPILEAFAYAHERGVVHRDVKPGNILLAPGEDLGIPKVTDFGLAKILSDTSPMTKTGSKMGTMPYMAPEQFEGKKDISTGADVFALGILFWRLLAGRLPVEPDNMKACLLLYAGMEPMPKIASVRDDLPEGVQDFLDRACALDPGERFVDAGEMLKACEFGDAPVAATPVSAPASLEPASLEPAPIETQPAPQDTGLASPEVAPAQPASRHAESPTTASAPASEQTQPPSAAPDEAAEAAAAPAKKQPKPAKARSGSGGTALLTLGAIGAFAVPPLALVAGMNMSSKTEPAFVIGVFAVAIFFVGLGFFGASSRTGAMARVTGKFTCLTSFMCALLSVVAKSKSVGPVVAVGLVIAFGLTVHVFCRWSLGGGKRASAGLSIAHGRLALLGVVLMVIAVGLGIAEVEALAKALAIIACILFGITIILLGINFIKLRRV